ncbi:MAG: anaerobic ribonucleoside-triphosphate reductase activating protein [Firmicutes bacterium]|nr:anaerobic ribonucleoside-triphosphate reductase activating protein [Bacillota bacterium]
MNVQGIQKLSLLDYPGELCCTIFTGGCNMRCPFCHNAGIVLGNNLSESKIEWGEILQFLQKRIKLLDGVCISGGEPTLQKDLESRISEIKALGFLVKLDTNGTRPSVLKNLVQAGLVDYVAVDIKNTPQKYHITAGIEDFNIGLIQETIDFLLAGKVDYEFRTTVVKEFHEIDDIIAICKWLQGAKRYYLQKFTDSDNLIQSGLHSYSDTEMGVIKRVVQPIFPTVELRGL